ncbi:MAG: hypothetical protein WA765_19715 [Candidatus Acidiferrum sp.]
MRASKPSFASDDPDQGKAGFEPAIRAALRDGTQVYVVPPHDDERL